MNEQRWMFFDLGSTLIDESLQEKYIIHTIQSEFSQLGIEYAQTDILHAMETASIQYQNVVKTAVRMLSINDEQYLHVISKAVYLQELELMYPGVSEILDDLSGRFRLGVIANQAVGAEERLKKHGIHRFFSVFALSAEAGFSKPDERLFHYALKKAHCMPHDSYMVGDRLDNDIYPANVLGFQTIRVMQGFGKYQVPLNERYVPQHTFSSISDLAGFGGT